MPNKVPFATHNGNMGKNIDFAFLKSEEFSTVERIKVYGWEHMCSLRVPTYLDLVHEFYHNLRFGIGSGVSVVVRQVCVGMHSPHV